MAKKSNPNNLFVGNKHLNHDIGLRLNGNLRQAVCVDCNKHLQWLNYDLYCWLLDECSLTELPSINIQYEDEGNWL